MWGVADVVSVRESLCRTGWECPSTSADRSWYRTALAPSFFEWDNSTCFPEFSREVKPQLPIIVLVAGLTIHC